jgi:hypothetical protein
LNSRSPGYDAFRESQALISRKRSAEGREVGPLPAVANPRRKKRCRLDLRRFCETYLAGRFPLAWCEDHLRCIGKMQLAVVEGGRFAFAMPRGSGKTSLCEAAALWAVVYGHRRFVVLIGATAEAAKELLAAVKVEFETNDLLAADFPEVCHPVRQLEGMNNRANGQTLGGERTRITFTDEEVVLPTVAKSPASGAVLRAAGITGRIRGMKHAGSEGESIRPDLVVIDDPQTDESAASPTQNVKRERLLSGAVLGLAGPRVKISAVMPCTVIAPKDMADRILDRDEHPEWNGERTKLLYAFPTDAKLWDEYAEVRRSGLRDGRGIADATAFYKANRAAMDVGAQAAWAERFNPDELSAIQHGMNLMLSDRRAFLAEYQNEPEAESLGSGIKELRAEDVAHRDRLSGVDAMVVPGEATRLTAGFDVGGELCWYAVVAWDERFTGWVVDYGCWPRQNRAVFESRDARPGLSDVYPRLNESQRVVRGLSDLTDQVMHRPYRRSTGGELRIERGLADRGWQPDAVTAVVRRHPGLLYPSVGIGRTTNRTGVSEWKRRPGERSGYHWRLTVGEDRKRMVQFDPDAWKTFIWERLTTAPGGAGALLLPGRTATTHALLGEHCAAEYGEPVTIRGQTFDKWTVRPSNPDNHLFDVLVLAAVAASVAGVRWEPGLAPTGPPPERQSKPAVDFAELVRRNRAAKQGR